MSNAIMGQTPVEGRRGIAPAHRDLGSAVKRTTSVIIKVQLAQPQHSVHGPLSNTIETPKRPEAVAQRGPHRSSIHDADIEMIEFSSHPAVRDWRQSTERLVPCSTRTSSFTDADQDCKWHHVPLTNSARDRPMPDYKPIPLRGPFLVFLFVFIAGTFAFLEYQVHDLPPVRYSVMNLDVTGRAKQDTQTESTELNGIQQTSRSIPDAYNPVRFITITRAAPARRAMMMAPAPEPEPNPRPPETAYPSPAAPMSYCGWYAPKWTVSDRGINPVACDQLPRDKPGYNLCDTASNLSMWDLQERIDTFVTDDPSWCPCRASMKYWGSEEIENELHYIHDWWDTDDEGCKSVMIAIESVNYYKWGVVYTPATTTGEPTSSQSRYYAYSTPPPQASAQVWPLPRTAAGGNIMLPLVVRTAGTEVMDVFGNKVKPTDTATFPVNFYSKPPWDRNIVPTSTLPCFLKSNKFFWALQECTSIPVPTGTSILWWQLPLSRPTLTSAVTTEPAPSPTPSDLVGASVAITTSTAQRISGIHGQPICTSCETSIMKPSDVTPSTASETPTQGPSMTDSSALVSLVTSSSSLEHKLPATESSPSAASAQLGSEADSETRSMTVEPNTSTAQKLDTLHITPESSSTSLIPIGMIVTNDQSSSTRTTFISSTIRPSPQTSSSKPEATSPSLAAGVSSNTNAENDLPDQTSHTQDESLTRNSNTGTLLPSPRPSPRPSPESISPSPVTLSSPFQEPHSSESHRTGNKTKDNISQSINPSNALVTQPSSLTPSALPLDVIPTSSPTSTTTRRNRPPDIDPKPHPPGPVSPEVQSTFSNLRSEASYLLASVIPVLLTTLLSIPIQVFASSLNCLLPFRGLTSRSPSGLGGKAKDTLLLSRNPSLLSCQITSFRFLKEYKDPLPFLSMVLSILALVLVPISSEVIRLELTSESGCDMTDFGNVYQNHFLRICAFGLRKSGGLIRVAEGILCVMAVLVLALGVLLGRWRSGLASPTDTRTQSEGKEMAGAGNQRQAEPWSIAHMAGLLATCQELASLLRGVGLEKDADAKREMKLALDGMRFRLGWFPSSPGGKSDLDRRGEQTKVIYGIEVVHPALEDKAPLRLTKRDPPKRKATAVKRKGLTSWFSTMLNEVSLRVLALLFTIGLLALILVYENTIAPDTAFERFMDSQSFGVRILFTVFGTVISLFWGYYFSQTSESQIHRHLAISAHQGRASAGLTPQQSIYLSPPSDVFVGLYRSVFHTRDFHSFNIALAALLAKFTPILLSNIPFYNTVTFKIHEACTWMAVIVLAYMVLVLAGGLVLSCGWPFKKTALDSWIVLREAMGRRRNSISISHGGGVLDGRNTTKHLGKGKAVDLPVKVDTMAGCMYYVCDSRMLLHLQQSLAEHGGGDDIRAIHQNGLGIKDEERYFLGETVGMVSGEKRVGVDYLDDV